MGGGAGGGGFPGTYGSINNALGMGTKSGAVANATVNGKVGNKTGKEGEFIDNTTDTMTISERRVVDDLVAQGKTVERVPKDPNAIDKSPDYLVDGVKTELKTLQNANTNTGMKRIQEGFKQGAETVIIDARGAGLTDSQAIEIINRASGKYQNGQIPGNVEIWIDNNVITYP